MDKPCFSRKILKTRIDEYTSNVDEFLQNYKGDMLSISLSNKDIQFNGLKQIYQYMNIFNLANANNFYTKEAQLQALNIEEICALQDKFIEDLIIVKLAESIQNIRGFFRKKKNQKEFKPIFEKMTFSEKEIEKISKNVFFSKFEKIRDYFEMYADEIAQNIERAYLPIFIYSLYLRHNEDGFMDIEVKSVLKKRSMELRYTKSKKYDLDSETNVFETAQENLAIFIEINTIFSEEYNLNWSLSLYEFNNYTNLLDIYELSNSISNSKLKNTLLDDKLYKIEKKKQKKRLKKFIQNEKSLLLDLKEDKKFFNDNFYKLEPVSFKLYIGDALYNPIINDNSDIWIICEKLFKHCKVEIERFVENNKMGILGNNKKFPSEIINDLIIIELFGKHNPYDIWKNINFYKMDPIHKKVYRRIYKEAYSSINKK
ncbi:hypothetical protein J2D69_19285 [Lysinibacillus sphaericus]|uniref:Uncharacterized protein n=3 Tax=Lysinibacillus TaxID=400634 RepID=W7RFK9_LYSSH|nr:MULTISPECIES: hypothetical protein [Lysinibacillus]MBE5084375.1 hypothetical protein [Bacillus thuringiensis]ACA38110.1 hypothetical protein Bsph_0485 [Lysinibacillus sphaericus C3-41]AMO32280.1 hypothetical protein AR327_07265 [Lysinibacillus sphaericus]AMR92621.1 hypothetical protein A1T07_21945 [Lysinibacillus sphaericus]ANA46670.1 hypothetical protein A2J09_14615 [Lysinibacillus sphaericus]